MKVTVQDIYNLKEGLNYLNEKELPISIAYKLQRISLKVNDEYKAASNLRTKIIEKYKEKNLDNGNVKIKEDKLTEFNNEIKELMEQKVDIKLEIIKVTDLGDTIKPSVLINIERILKEGDKE